MQTNEFLLIYFIFFLLKMHTFFFVLLFQEPFYQQRGALNFRSQALPSINKNNRKITFTFDKIVLFTFLFGYYYSVHTNHFFFIFKERRAIVFLYHRFVMTNSVEFIVWIRSVFRCMRFKSF